MSKMIKNELKFIVPCVFIADIAVYLLSFIFKGVTLSMFLGLLLGSVALILNLCVLGSDIELALKRFALDKNEKRAKNKMTTSYILRSFIVAVVIFLSLISDLFDTIGVVIPFLYVKPIYMIKSSISHKKEGK